MWRLKSVLNSSVAPAGGGSDGNRSGVAVETGAGDSTGFACAVGCAPDIGGGAICGAAHPLRMSALTAIKRKLNSYLMLDDDPYGLLREGYAGAVYTSHAMELDHVVILVEDLDAAQRQWRDAGFDVTPGGVHTDGLTHNALICFADGSYIELLAFRTAAATAHRWDRFRAFPGPIDYAIAVNDLPTFVQQINGHGLDYTEAIEGGRQRPDGVAIRWRTSWPPQGAEGLPFLIEDLTPRELRVPAGEYRSHPNGAQRIAELTVAVNNLERATHDLATLFSSTGTSANEACTFTLDGAVLRIHRMPEDTALVRRGPSPASLTLALANGDVWRYG